MNKQKVSEVPRAIPAEQSVLDIDASSDNCASIQTGDSAPHSPRQRAVSAFANALHQYTLNTAVDAPYFNEIDTHGLTCPWSDMPMR